MFVVYHITGLKISIFKVYKLTKYQIKIKPNNYSNIISNNYQNKKKIKLPKKESKVSSGPNIDIFKSCGKLANSISLKTSGSNEAINRHKTLTK